MASYNPYRLDPNIAQGFSNLTRALIGSAQDDADIARAGLLNEQARGVGLDNTGKENYMKARNTALDDASIVSAMFDTFGLKEPRINKDFDPSVSMAQAPAEAYGQFSSDGMRGLVEAMLFGEGGTANQTAQAAALMRGMAQSEEGRDLIRNSGESLARQAMMMQGVNPTKWLEGDHVETNLANTFIAELDKNEKVLEGTLDKNELELEASKFKSTKDAEAEVKSAEITADAKEAYENFRTETNAKVNQEKNQLQFGEGGSVDRVAELEDKFNRWKHENREIEMSVEAGKKLVLDPETGERLGLKPNEEGLYVLDGGKDATKVAVKVGKEDVYLSKEHADALGIKVNDKGLYVIPGAGYASDGSSSSSSGSGSGSTASGGTILDSTRFQTMWATNWKDYGTEDMPNHAIGGLQVAASNAIARDKEEAEANGAEFNFQQSYTANALPMISAGVIEITKGSNFFFPKYFFDFFTRMPDSSFNAEKLKQYSVRTLGYNDKQAERMMSEVLKARAGD
jgi:hypothetical protein